MANNARKTQKLPVFVQGCNLEVHNIIYYTRKYRATVLYQMQATFW